MNVDSDDDQDIVVSDSDDEKEKEKPAEPPATEGETVTRVSTLATTKVSTAFLILSMLLILNDCSVDSDSCGLRPPK